MIIAAWLVSWLIDVPPGAKKNLREWAFFTVLVLALARLIWRALHQPPTLPDGMHGWEKRAARAGHAALYVLMLAIPVSGYLYSSAAGVQVVYLGVLPLPMQIRADPATAAVLQSIHIYLNYSLLFAVAGHLLAVIKHELIDRQRLLSRMLPFGR